MKKISSFFDDLLVILRDFWGFILFSIAKKIRRPILANLPTYYVPTLSKVALPTYLPKNGTSLVNVPFCWILTLIYPSFLKFIGLYPNKKKSFNIYVLRYCILFTMTTSAGHTYVCKKWLINWLTRYLQMRPRRQGFWKRSKN